VGPNAEHNCHDGLVSLMIRLHYFTLSAYVLETVYWLCRHISFAMHSSDWSQSPN